MADKNRIYNFSTDSYWQARLRQGNCCANCSDDLGDLPRTEAPGHHSGITKQEAAAFGLENNPDWVRSSENCVVYCRECHAAFAHDGGRFRDRVELPEKMTVAHPYNWAYTDKVMAA